MAFFIPQNTHTHKYILNNVSTVSVHTWKVSEVQNNSGPHWLLLYGQNKTLFEIYYLVFHKVIQVWNSKLTNTFFTFLFLGKLSRNIVASTMQHMLMHVYRCHYSTECSSQVPEVKSPLIFSIGELFFNDNL